MANGRRAEILGNLPLSAPFVAVVEEIITNLGCDDDPITFRSRESPRQKFLAATVAIGVGRVKEGDTKVCGKPHQAHGLLIGKSPPPSGGNRPKSETDFTDLQIGSLQRAVIHRGQSYHHERRFSKSRELEQGLLLQCRLF